MLVETKITENGIEEVDKVKVAIQRLQAFEPPEGYWLAFSGGKDSVVIKKLAEMSGVKFEAHYSVTSVDPPELVKFIKAMNDVCFDIPRDKDGNAVTMWNLIVKHSMPPTRLVRYCCEKLKESGGGNRLVVTGVRWAESVRRKHNRNLVNISNTDKDKRIVLNDDNDESRRTVEHCYRTQKTIINPIIDWANEDVWEFIHKYNVPYCKLYDEGWSRIGCIGCPMNTRRKEELKIYPKYKTAYLHAFEKMLKNHDIHNANWKTAEDVMNWWTSNKSGNWQDLNNRTKLFD